MASPSSAKSTFQPHSEGSHIEENKREHRFFFIRALQTLRGVALLIAQLPLLLKQHKYLNNIIEQDHRFIKKIIKPMLRFKSFKTAEKTIAEIEVMHMIRKGQVECNHSTVEKPSP
jgi:transposase-like protein